MQNLGSLACSVWAVGGGWFENPAAHLIFGGNLYKVNKLLARATMQGWETGFSVFFRFFRFFPVSSNDEKKFRNSFEMFLKNIIFTKVFKQFLKNVSK